MRLLQLYSVDQGMAIMKTPSWIIYLCLCSCSPNGVSLVAPNALFEGSSTAAIIDRVSGDTGEHLVAHRLPIEVTVCRYSIILTWY
jgi:hypothetical protein